MNLIHSMRQLSPIVRESLPAAAGRPRSALLDRCRELALALCALAAGLAPVAADPGDPPVLVESQQFQLGGDLVCFGWDVDVEGDVAVASAPFFPPSGKTAIYERNGTSWQEVAQVTSGSDVATDGTHVAIAYGGNANIWVDGGASWVLDAQIPISPQGSLTTDLDMFEGCLAVTRPNAVDLWELQGGTWTFVTSLTGSDTQAGDGFGGRVSIYDRVVAVGAPFAGSGVGAAYVFLEVGGQWTEVEKLVPADGQPGWNFGAAVAIDGGNLAVGAPGYSFAPDERGAIYTYRQTGPTWSPVQTLVYTNTGGAGGQQSVGWAVDLQDDWLLGGFRFFDSTFVAANAPLYHHAGGQWSEVAKLSGTPDIFGNTMWGGGVGLQPGWAVVGAPPRDFGQGAVHFYPLEAPPAVTCTGKTNSDGCVGRIGSCGLPSAMQAVPFDVTAADVLGQKPGLLIYGYAPDALPFLGGTLCIQPPVRRTRPTVSAGDATPCSGTLAFDFQARITSGVDPVLAPGQAVFAQWWHRDPPDPFGAGLTDALAFTIWL